MQLVSPRFTKDSVFCVSTMRLLIAIDETIIVSVAMIPSGRLAIIIIQVNTSVSMKPKPLSRLMSTPMTIEDKAMTLVSHLISDMTGVSRTAA